MKDSHLLNTIAMLERYSKAKTNYLINKGFSFLSSLSGEMAIMSVEQDLDRLISHELDFCEIHPLFKNLLLDQQRREVILYAEKSENFLR